MKGNIHFHRIIIRNKLFSIYKVVYLLESRRVFINVIYDINYLYILLYDSKKGRNAKNERLNHSFLL